MKMLLNVFFLMFLLVNLSALAADKVNLIVVFEDAKNPEGSAAYQAKLIEESITKANSSAKFVKVIASSLQSLSEQIKTNFSDSNDKI